MHGITPEMLNVVEQLGYDNGPVSCGNEIRLYTGRLSHVIYYSAFGAPAVSLSSVARDYGVLGDDVLVAAVTHNHGGGIKRFEINPDNGTIEGHIGHQSATFHIIRLADILSEGSTYFRVPGLALKFGLNKSEVDRPNVSQIYTKRKPPLKNLVGRVLIPVVEDEDKGGSYFVNVLGETFNIPTMTTTETGWPTGLYRWRGGNDKRKFLGTIESHLFVGPSSLKQDIVLFTNGKDAGTYKSAETYYALLDSTAKSEAIMRERDLNRAKSETAQLDNRAKVETIKAKEEYETRSIGRKDTLEEASFARSATLGVAALATAALGVLVKLGSTVTMRDLVLTSITNQAVPCIVLGALLSGSILNESISNVVSSVISGVGNIIAGSWYYGTTAIRGVVTIGASILRGVGRLIGI